MNQSMKDPQYGTVMVLLGRTVKKMPLVKSCPPKKVCWRKLTSMYQASVNTACCFLVANKPSVSMVEPFEGINLSPISCIYTPQRIPLQATGPLPWAKPKPLLYSGYPKTHQKVSGIVGRPSDAGTLVWHE